MCIACRRRSVTTSSKQRVTLHKGGFGSGGAWGAGCRYLQGGGDAQLGHKCLEDGRHIRQHQPGACIDQPPQQMRAPCKACERPSTRVRISAFVSTLWHRQEWHSGFGQQHQAGVQTFTLLGVGRQGHVGKELHEVLAQRWHDIGRVQRGQAPGHGHRQCPHRAALVVQRHK